ncbi:MAG: hypothetical protein RLZZ86_42 [Cyanobacteriota bacterium]|jgi:hypothetical protein
MAIKNTNTSPLLQEGANVTLTESGQVITISSASASPAGTDTQVQFNDGGAFGGDAGLTYNKTDNILSVESIDFAQTPVAADAERRLKWDNDEGSLVLTLKGGNVTIPLGGEVVALVHNAESFTLTKGTVVYAFGASGQRVSVKRAVNTSDATSAQVLGVVAEPIATGAEGWVMVQGFVRGLDTSTYTQGDALYLSSTAGQFTKTKQYAPNHLVYVGFAVKISASAGEIFVKCQNGYEMDELHNVSAQSPSNNDILAYNTSTNLWEKKQLSAINGITGTGSNTQIAYFTGTNAIASESTLTWDAANDKLTVGTNLTINGTAVEQSDANGLTLNSSNASGSIYFRVAGAERMNLSNTGVLKFISGNLDVLNFKFSSSYGNTNIGVTFDSGSNAGNYLNLKVNTASGTATERLKLGGDGKLYLNAYTSASSFTGSAQGILGFANDGSIITLDDRVSGSGSTNQVAFFDGTKTIKSEAALFWDQTNDRLTVGNTESGVGKIGANSATGQVGFNVGTSSSPERGNIYFTTDGTGWKMNIGKYQSSTFSSIMTIHDSERVSIGSTSDSGEKFQVNGSEKINGNSRIIGVITSGADSSTNGTVLIKGYYTNGEITTLGTEYSNGGPVLGYAVTPSTSAAEAFLSSTGINIGRGAYTINGGQHKWFAGSAQTVTVGNSVTMSTLMTLTSGGNLGIGNTPSYKLEVTGDAKVTTGALGVNVNPNATDGRIDASNDIVAYSSDRRLKENIKDIESPIEKVQKLKGFTYNWNDLANQLAGYNTNESLVGVFAQDVQEVLPEAVKLAPFDNNGYNKSISGEDYLTVQYEKLVPLLIEAIKDLQNQINELKK